MAIGQVGNSDKRRALGKGLDSLLPRVAPAAPPPPPAAAVLEGEAGKPLEIELDAIDRNPYQTRTNFDEKLIAELSESIAANGVVQPILVRNLPNGRYQLIAGERRWLASQKAGKATIPAIDQIDRTQIAFNQLMDCRFAQAAHIRRDFAAGRIDRATAQAAASQPMASGRTGRTTSC